MALVQYDLILLLESEPVPKTNYALDILLTHDTTIFATSSSEPQFIKSVALSRIETDTMNVRWKKFHYSISPCPRCFAKQTGFRSRINKLSDTCFII